MAALPFLFTDFFPVFLLRKDAGNKKWPGSNQMKKMHKWQRTQTQNKIATSVGGRGGWNAVVVR